MKLLYYYVFLLNILSAGLYIQSMGFCRAYKSFIKHPGNIRRFYRHTQQNSHIIEQVVMHTNSLFASVPGYNKVVEKLYTSLNGLLPHVSKGSLYELQVALDFHNRGHRICAFDKIYKNTKIGLMREIDIITDLCAIECKNINWDIVKNSPHITQKIRDQIQEQHALVNSGIVGVPHYIFCSKNAIPPQECSWLREQGIFYFVYSPDMVY